MKKKGLLNRLVKAGILAATLGGTIYLLKDKIEESPKYRDAFNKLKDIIKKSMPGTKNAPDYSEDFEDDFEDVEELDEILKSTPSDREYVSIKLSEERNHEADEDGMVGSDPDSTDQAEDAVDEEDPDTEATN